MSKNKQETPPNQFLKALIAYLVIIILATIFLIPVFKKIKKANFQYKEKMALYQTLNLQNPSFNKISPINCDGNLFFKVNSPVVSLRLFNDYLLVSSLNQKIIAVNIKDPRIIFSTDGLATYFYPSSSLEVLATDFLNNKIIKIKLSDTLLTKEIFQEKIGRPSAIAKDYQGNLLVSGYASGNIIKINGPEKTIFTSDLDKVIGMEVNQETIYIARYDASPSLISHKASFQKIIEKEKWFSDLTSDGVNIWAVYQENNQTKLGKIENDSLKEVTSINCPFPLKIAISKEALFYTALNDFEGKIYFTKNNRQIIGR